MVPEYYVNKCVLTWGGGGRRYEQLSFGGKCEEDKKKIFEEVKGKKKVNIR